MKPEVSGGHSLTTKHIMVDVLREGLASRGWRTPCVKEPALAGPCCEASGAHSLPSGSNNVNVLCRGHPHQGR